jgi:flagellar export protein FliJ
MKRFAFSLQRLLDYRTQVLEAERATLAEMNAVMRRFVQELADMKADWAKRTQELIELAARGTGAYELQRHSNYLRVLDEEIFNKQVQIEMQQKVIDRQEERVRETKMEIQTIEKLKENKLEEYNYLDRKEQEQFIEEFVSNAKVSALPQGPVS